MTPSDRPSGMSNVQTLVARIETIRPETPAAFRFPPPNLFS